LRSGFGSLSARWATVTITLRQWIDWTGNHNAETFANFGRLNQEENTMKKTSPFIASVAGFAILALAGYVQAFSGHGDHHRASAFGACLAAAPKSAMGNLRSPFESSSLDADRQALQTAKQNVAQFILGINTTTPLSTLESNLSMAEMKVVQDEDAIAQSVCKQLSPAQLAAASTLYTNLQNNRQTVHGYFAAARQAAEGGQ
jgi:hypothetical protein